MEHSRQFNYRIKYYKSKQHLYSEFTKAAAIHPLTHLHPYAPSLRLATFSPIRVRSATPPPFPTLSNLSPPQLSPPPNSFTPKSDHIHSSRFRSANVHMREMCSCRSCFARVRVGLGANEIETYVPVQPSESAPTSVCGGHLSG